MQQIETPNKLFTDGTRQIPGTRVPAWWLNQLQNELVNVLKAAGIEPDKADEGQVAKALHRLIADRSTTVVESVAALRELAAVAENQVVTVRGYHADTPGVGGGLFYAAEQSAADNGGTVIAATNGWVWHKFDTELTPEDFGARGDGQADDTAAFEALERVVKHQRVDLGGKTFKTGRNFNGNRYINGIITTGRNQDFANGQPGSTQTLLGNGGGTLLTMVRTLPDERPGRAARTILQGAAQDPRTGEWWTLQPHSDVPDDAGTGTVEASVLVRYPATYAGNSEVSHLQVSEASKYFGHQSIAIAYQNGQRYFWVTGGNAKRNKRQLYIVRCQVGADGRIEDLSDYAMFSDGLFNGDGNNCLAVSPDGQFIAVTSKYTANNRWVCRVWRIADLIHGGDNTDNWLYEMPLRSHNLPVQDIATDGDYIYVLHGGDASKSNVISIFTLTGDHVADYGDDTGKDLMTTLTGKGYNAYYEPEGLAVANIGGQLVLTMWLMLGKKSNHHACAVYAMRPLMSGVATEPTTYLGDAASVPKEFVVKAAGAKVFTAGVDSNNFGRVHNGQDYLGITVVNNDSTGRRFAVLNQHVQGSKGGAITAYSLLDDRGASENIGVLRLAGAISESYLDIGQVSVHPSHTDKASLGKANKRWTQVFAQSGVIATSDERLKQDIGSIPDAVIEAWRAVGWCQFRWRDAVAEKGAGARYHTGLIAQSIKAAFDTHDLDAQDYGLLCYDQWPETPAREAVVDEHGNVLEQAVEHQPAGERWSVRIDECLVLEAESNRRTIAELQQRLEKVEKTLLSA